MEEMIFSAEEKEKIDKAIKVVTEDLRSLYNASAIEKIDKVMNVVTRGFRSLYNASEIGLVITKKEMYRYKPYSEPNYLDKISLNGKQNICSVRNYNMVFDFLKHYENIRSSIVEEIKRNQEDKTKGMIEIEKIFNKYTKEATLEIEMPDAISKPTIELSTEDGKNIGKLTIGPISLKILTTANVKIKGNDEKTKVKKK